MQMFQKGRSMIEMLGVLAIIGVLSIGGIVLYRRAVNNHQANTILDDVNRFAFVILESGRAFKPYDNITGLDYTKTSTYFLNAFTEATSQQFAIMVTNVPRGVCEALLPKAAVEYKVRTLEADTIQEIAQVSPNAVLYDGQNTDICSDLNDVVLYFGDVSKQCTATGQEDCTSNADCCHGSFCWFQHRTTCAEGECECTVGKCKLISTYVYDGLETMSDGNSWAHSVTMSWQSGKNWCEAQGLRSVAREDIDCKDAEIGDYCQSSKMNAIHDKWSGYGWHWLEPTKETGRIYIVYPSNKHITYQIGPCGGRGFALCH